MFSAMTDTPGTPRLTRTRPRLQNHHALRAARLDAGLTVRQLAERAGVSVSLIREAEKGRCGLSDESLKRLADALGRPVATLANPDAVGGQPVIDLMDKGAGKQQPGSGAAA
jgi:transcriptional regulator with XRE-family HTH domain